MEEILSLFKEINVLGIPLDTLSAALLIIIFAFLLRKLFARLIVRNFDRAAKRATVTFDELLLRSVEGPVQLIIIGIGFYIARIILSAHLQSQEKMLNQGFQLYFLFVICFLIYRSTDLLVFYLQKLVKRTRTELDDLLLPYFKKLVQIILVVLVIIKIAEILLGISIAALFGLLGGMGLTLGLVFKDIVANWFGCGVIYLDNLFRVGDWVSLDDGKLIDADVEEIGLRSTIFRNFDKTVSIVPNGIIANAVVKNWSRMFKRRIKYSFKIDGVAAAKMNQVLKGIRKILADDADVHQEFHMVNFREIEGNSRIIRLYYFTKTTVWAEHEQVRENVNLKILKLFEKLSISRLAYTVVDLSDDRPHDFTQSVDKNVN